MDTDSAKPAQLVIFCALTWLISPVAHSFIIHSADIQDQAWNKQMYSLMPAAVHFQPHAHTRENSDVWQSVILALFVFG